MKNLFIVFLFGVMAGYFWQHYHQNLLVKELKQEIRDNREIINTIQEKANLLYQTQRIIMCESGWRHDAVGDGGKARGIAQFHLATFNRMKRLAAQPQLQWRNPAHQVWLLQWALTNGYGDHWSCYKSLSASLRNLGQ